MDPAHVIGARSPLKIEGQNYRGAYVLEKGMITVNMVGGGSSTTHETSARNNNETLAKIILAELVAKEKANRDM